MKRLLLLLNMGGPNNLGEVEVFLKNMFNDPCILGIKSEILRKFVAFMITRGRLKTAQENYKQIGGKSPICELTQRLCDKILALQDCGGADKISQNLCDGGEQERGDEAEFDTRICADKTAGRGGKAGAKFDAVDYAMNYTPPFARDVLARYADFDEIVVLPLYPHHSVTTIVSSVDDFKRAFEELNLKAKFKIIGAFYDDKIYNDAVVQGIKNKVQGRDVSDVTLIFSAHSLPQKTIDRGDIYEQHVKAHVEILSGILADRGVKFKEIRLAYQSRLGPVKWLEPALGDVLAQLNPKKALIYPISFCIDNSETIFELVKEYKHVADGLKFEYYDVVPCLNDSDEFAKFILKITE